MGYVETGPIQRGQVKFANVGQIVEVVMKEDVVWSGSNKCYSMPGRSKRDCSSPWSPSFVKISTNNPKTGIGNGVYYVKPRGDLKVGTYGIKGEGDKLVDNTEDLKANLLILHRFWAPREQQLQRCPHQVR